MEIEDGVIWVYGVGEDGVQAFTESGIENLIELIQVLQRKPHAAQALTTRPAAYAEWIRSYVRDSEIFKDHAGTGLL